MSMPQIKGMVDIAADVKFGELCIVWNFTTICPGVEIGDRCAIGGRVYIGRNTKIGSDVRIQDGAHITDHMTIGDGVFIGAHVVTMNDRYPEVNNPQYKNEPPIIEDDVAIGCNATILPGVRLGRGCMIAAGAIIAHDVEPGMIVRGEPARHVLPRT